MSQAEPTLTLEHEIKVSPDVVFRTLDGEAVLLNLQSGVYFGLNQTGTRIWSMLSENTSLSEVHSRIVKEYEVEPELARSDLLTLTKQLAQKGLITILR